MRLRYWCSSCELVAPCPFAEDSEFWAMEPVSATAVSSVIVEDRESAVLRLLGISHSMSISTTALFN